MSGGAAVGYLELADSSTVPESTLSKIRSDHRIDYVSTDSPTIPTSAGPAAEGVTVPDDPLSSEQWHLGSSNTYPSAINLYEARSITEGTSRSVVALIDTGVRYEHPDMTGRLLPGYDFIQSPDRANDGDGRDSDASDPGNGVDDAFNQEMQRIKVNCPVQNSTWHGTAMASLIAANSNDGYGIAGLDGQAYVLPVRAVGRCGGLRSDLLDSIRWAAGVVDPSLPHNPTPARIINISLAIQDACSEADQSAIDDAVNAGAIVVAGAGNGNTSLNEHPVSPATCHNVVTVAALKADGELADYSNYGRTVDLSAPGGDDLNHRNFPIITASNQGKIAVDPVSLHRVYSGTSVATPLVSGVLSLMLSINSELSSHELHNLLIRSTRQFPANVECNTTLCGSGMLDANLAVRNTLAYGDGSFPAEQAAAIASPPAVLFQDPTNGTGSIGILPVITIIVLFLRKRERRNANGRRKNISRIGRLMLVRALYNSTENHQIAVAWYYDIVPMVEHCPSSVA